MYHLAAAELDRDRGRDAPPPGRSYVICSTPRSGSSLLSEALAGTGCLGTPLEYFDRTSAHGDLRLRWGCPDMACFVRCLHRYRVGPDGVLGVKLHWFQLADVTAELAANEPARRGYERARAAMERIAPGAALVHVQRHDRDRQAVSWAVAELTGCWERRGSDEVPTVDDVDPAHIADCRRRIEENERAWAQFFHRTGQPVASVTYEELVADYEASVRRVTSRLGAADATVPAPTLVRQADRRSDALLARYRSSSEELGVDSPSRGRSAPRS
jgi:trehalose 2-sulfotransferase